MFQCEKWGEERGGAFSWLLACFVLILTLCKGYVKNRCVRVCGVEMQFIFYSGTVLSVKSRPISIYKFNLGRKCTKYRDCHFLSFPGIPISKSLYCSVHGILIEYVSLMAFFDFSSFPL